MIERFDVAAVVVANPYRALLHVREQTSKEKRVLRVVHFCPLVTAEKNDPPIARSWIVNVLNGNVAFEIRLTSHT